VPTPVRALNGDPVVESGGHRLVLAHRIPGDPGWRADLLLTRRCGHALALLDLALATVTLAVGAPETYRRLDLDAAVRSVEAEFAGSGLASAIAEVLDRTDEQWSRVTAGWPVQLVHADYFPPNVLVVNGDVTGVIDFEFAGNGFRAMDFAIGLIAFGTEWWEFRTSWELLEAFASGYLAVNPLSPEERAEVPALILMREASSYTHWLGRLARGMIAPEEIQARGRRLLDLDRWLSAYGDDLITRLARIDRC
jgi:Ser/Thr protein kinase RdoA (MazF antagonist)